MTTSDIYVLAEEAALAIWDVRAWDYPEDMMPFIERALAKQQAQHEKELAILEVLHEDELYTQQVKYEAELDVVGNGAHKNQKAEVEARIGAERDAAVAEAMERACKVMCGYCSTYGPPSGSQHFVADGLQSKGAKGRFVSCRAVAISALKPRSDLVCVPSNVVAFLLGEESLCGFWFGETPKDEGNFWWRKHIRSAVEEKP